MKLYPIPGGTWAGTEADWKKAMKAKGHNPKDYPGSREVPVAKADLLEFLNFFAVDVFRTGDDPMPAAAPDTVVDVAALRALHNPDSASLPEVFPALASPTPAANQSITLDTLFEAAPIGQQLQLAVSAIDAVFALITAHPQTAP